MNEQTFQDDQRSLEELVADWLESEAAGEVPDWLLQSTFDVTRRERQRRGVRHWLTRLAGALRWRGGGASKRGFEMTAAARVVTVAILIAALGTGLVLSTREGPRTSPASVTDSAAEEAQAAGLFEVTLDADAIPEELAGILVFRKIYPTDQDIVYGSGFVPPNTFVRHVESGELGIRPVSETRIIRAGSTWADAEVVAAGEEAIVEPGDTFIMHEVPWDEYGPQALGEMWTPGEDARVVGFAIRESSRCCSMTHAGMRSPWYHTLVSGVKDLRGQPVRLRMLRWDAPVGAELPLAFEGGPTLAAVDTGSITATVDQGPGQEPAEFRFQASMAVQLPQTLDPASPVRFESTGTEPAVVYQLVVEPAATAAPGEPVASIRATETGQLRTARGGHDAILLADGRVLVSGGDCPGLEVYDEESGVFEEVSAAMTVDRASATLLQDGRVLLAGGDQLDAELYDPPSGSVIPAATMNEMRDSPAATRLLDGRVLISGGQTASAEVYDPATNTFTATGSMSTARSGHAAVLLRDGRVLVAGDGPSLELYDPASGTFSPSQAAGQQPLGRGASATLLMDGRVLLIGRGGPPQLYDPRADTVTATSPMVVPRSYHATATLDDGRVLVIGGMAEGTLAATASVEVYDPRTAMFQEAGSLSVPRWQLTATKLCDEKILVAGGTAVTIATRSAELLEAQAIANET